MRQIQKNVRLGLLRFPKYLPLSPELKNCIKLSFILADVKENLASGLEKSSTRDTEISKISASESRTKSTSICGQGCGIVRLQVCARSGLSQNFQGRQWCEQPLERGHRRVL